MDELFDEIVDGHGESSEEEEEETALVEKPKDGGGDEKKEEEERTAGNGAAAGCCGFLCYMFCCTLESRLCGGCAPSVHRRSAPFAVAAWSIDVADGLSRCVCVRACVRACVCACVRA